VISIEDKIKKYVTVVVIALIVISGIIYNFYKNNFGYENIIEKNESIQTNTILNSQNETNEENRNEIKVYVTGEVKSPGVISLEEGARLEDAIEKAGGLTENANIKNVNLAYIIEDGLKIYIPNKDEENVEYLITENGDGIIEETEIVSSESKININTASLEKLTELPGVGEALAQRIIDYRTANGKFTSIEELKNVSGIGDKKFENLRDSVSIK
jgi:competence protein ComEA